MSLVDRLDGAPGLSEVHLGWPESRSLKTPFRNGGWVEAAGLDQMRSQGKHYGAGRLRRLLGQSGNEITG